MRGLCASLGLGPCLVVVTAFLVIGTAYCTNHDMGGDPKSARGDGRYRPVLARGDGHLIYLMARSMAYDGDLDFTNDLARFGDPFTQPKTPTGYKAIPHPIGVPLVWTPFLWAAEGGAAVANLGGADIPLHGYTLWHQRIVFFSSVLAAWLAIGLGIAVARRALGGGRWGPAYAGAAILLGTSLTYYATYMPSYTHAIDAGASAGFLAAWALTLGRWDARRAILLGATLGFAGLVRSQELALGVVVAVEAAIAVVRRDASWAARARIAGWSAAVVAIALVVMIPQAIAWNAVFGKWSALPQGPNYTRPHYPLIPELLFAAKNGWFATHPLAYAGTLGLVLMAVRGPRLARGARAIALGFLAAIALQVYLNSIILDWWGQASFGNRRLCSMTLPLVVGLATWIHQAGALLARLRGPRAAGHVIAVVVLGWFVAWNLQQVWPLRGGKPAQFSAGPACCRQVKWPQRAIARPIYDAVGNPFAWPASAIFSLRYGLPLQRWDLVHGEYPWLPPIDYTPASLRGSSVQWNLGSSNSQPYLVGGFGKSQSGPGRPVRWTTARRAEVIVPNLLPDPLKVSLWLQPNLAPGVVGKPVVIRWNGDVVARATLGPGPTTLTWNIRGDVGDNLLAIEAALDAPVPIAGLATPAVPVGVAAGELRFSGQ